MMNCLRAQRALSERMDGERLAVRAETELDRHVTTCLTCQAFAARAEKIHRSVRIRTSEQIPDLTERIMLAVETDADQVATGPGRERRRHRTDRRRPAPIPGRAQHRRGWAPVAASLVVGVLAGSFVVGGPWHRPSLDSVQAVDIVKGVRVAARRLRSFEGRSTITERGLPGAELRTMQMSVAFSAPQRYRLQVTDSTAYAQDGWTPTDLTYIANGTAVYESGPALCPSVIRPLVCPPGRLSETESAAYAPQAPLAADLIVPVDILGNARHLTVLGRGTVLGRDAIQMELPFERAEPLFAFRAIGGTWRPIFPQDRVVAWFDATNWFPLRATVFPSADPDRHGWSQRYGLPDEDPTTPILEVVATSIATSTIHPRAFSIPGGVAPNAVPLDALRTSFGFTPIRPTFLAGLQPTSAVLPPRAAGPGAPDALITYSSGVSYLRVGERRPGPDPDAQTPAPTAHEVRLPIGIAYYQPPTSDQGRRLTIHTARRDFVLETNLSRDELLQVASSLPVRGKSVGALRVQKRPSAT